MTERYNNHLPYHYNYPETKKPTKKKKPRKQAKAIYGALRNCCADLEELIGAGVFTDKEAKRLDKAVTVMKVGFKIIKKAIGARKTKRVALPRQTVATSATLQ